MTDAVNFCNAEKEEKSKKGGAEKEARLQPWDEVVRKFESLASSKSEEKVRFCLEYMKECLSRKENPYFKGFWEAKTRCLVYFKEHLNPASRALFWSEFIQLLDHAEQLKTIFDEHVFFAAEQIDLAIKDLRSNWGSYETLRFQVLDIEFPLCKTIEQKQSEYNQLQKELNLLNSWAVRVSSLRKEILRMPLRIRDKNRFLQELSILGSEIFSKRKEKILQVSHSFESDVKNLFFQKFFEKEEDLCKAPVFVLREEVKSLQNLTKILTLSTESFTELRFKLSQCWDQLKQFEKDHKKEWTEKKNQYKQIFEKIGETVRKFLAEAGSLASEQFFKRREEVLCELEQSVLKKEDFQQFKNEILKIKKPLAEKIQRQEKEIVKPKNEQSEEIKGKIEKLSREGEKMDLETLSKEILEIQEKIGSTKLSSWEEKNVEFSLKRLSDLLEDKKEKVWYQNLPSDKQQLLKETEDLLIQKKQQRQETKERLENCRKILGGSSLDFEKAITYRDMIDEEKERMEKLNSVIRELEEKIETLE